MLLEPSGSVLACGVWCFFADDTSSTGVLTSWCTLLCRLIYAKLSQQHDKPTCMWKPCHHYCAFDYTSAHVNTSFFSSSMWLSGGEKSYTTVAFALALGDWTQSPFRAMDEFDVFMDAINRRVAMENLFSNSLEHPDLQFIFLTPQVSLLA